MTIEQLQLTLDVMSLKNRVKKLEKWQDDFHKILNKWLVSLEEEKKEKSDG